MAAYTAAISKTKTLNCLTNNTNRERTIMYLSETYEKKWQPVLEHPDLQKSVILTDVPLQLLSWKTKKEHKKKTMLS